MGKGGFEMNTLLEIYDKGRPINNVLGAWYLRPSKIVYFYAGVLDELETRSLLTQMLRRIGIQTSVVFARIDRMDINDMADWMDAHRDSLGEYALELTGGDDVLLFMAGCSYARFHCPLYTRRLDGCFIALPSGEKLTGVDAAFTVEQRLMLSGGRLSRQGRLAGEALDEGFLSLAAHIFEIQRQNSRAWMQQTKCLQQRVADLPDDALDVFLTAEECRACGFTPQKGHQFKRLAAIGALTALSADESGIRAAFPDARTRDCLCDYGIWLELYIYSALRECGEFDDVHLSCVVQWSDESVINEIDVAATAGLGFLVISCKTSAPNMEAIAELNVLSDRFGAEYIHSLLACLPKGQAHLDGLRARCEEMDILLMDMRQYSRSRLVSFFRRLGQRLRAGKLK